MPFIINQIPEAGLSEAERKEIWKGFLENFQHSSGYSMYYPDDLRKCENFLKQAQDKDWWRREVVFKDEQKVKDWHGYDFKTLKYDMEGLAKFIWLRREIYHECADYVSVLWREKREQLKSIVGLLYFPNFLIKEKGYEFSRDACERLLNLKLSVDWPMNLQQAYPNAYDYALIEDIDDFFAWEFVEYFDAFLGNAVRVFKGDAGGSSSEVAGGVGSDGEPDLNPVVGGEHGIAP